MKKLVLLLLVCFIGYAAKAEMPINIGIHGGTSSNRINFRDLTNIHGSRASQGYMIGAFMRINMGGLYLEPSLNFAQKKSIAEGNRTSVADVNRPTYTIKNNTFQIPIMLGFQLIDLSIAKIRLFLGPQFSAGKLKNLKNLSNEIEPNKSYWSGKVGVGIDVWKLTFDVDYEKGLQKMAHELKAPRSYNFTLGLKII